MKKVILFTGMISVLISCGASIPMTVQGTVKFSEKESDIFTKPILKQYIKKTNEPTIVLRVPNSNRETEITDSDRYSDSEVYSTIEKELTKAGFAVRDRSLFNKLSTDNKVNDYSKLKELTNTELILEVVRANKVPYDTNKYINMKGIEKVAPFNIKMYGEKVEFRIINVKNNDIVGNYTFYYTPCVDGCTYIYDSLGGIHNIQQRGNKSKNSYEFISDKTQLERFYEVSTRRLTDELRK